MEAYATTNTIFGIARSHRASALACALSDMRGEVSAHADTYLLPLFCRSCSARGAVLVLAAPYASPPRTTPTTPATRRASRRAPPGGGRARAAQSDAAIAARQCSVPARPVA